MKNLKEQDMVKVLLCSPSPEATGGIATWTRNILKYNDSLENGCVNLLHFPLERKYFIDPTSTPFFMRIIYGIKDYWGILFRFRKEIKKQSPRIVHITTSASLGLIRDLIMVHILKRKGVRNLIHFHFGRISELNQKKNWEWYLLKYLIKKTDVAIVIDEKSYKTLLGAGHRNISFLPNPISLDLLVTIEKLQNIRRKDREILFVGHLVKTKGIFELVEACANIPNVKLKMMGEAQPGMKEQLLTLAMEKGSLEWIEIIPNQSSSIVIMEMLSTGVFVLPSYTEGFPNVILESMACSCPIVATTVGAIPEMLNCGGSEEAGICVPFANVTELQEAIERMLDDKISAQKCGKNAHDRVVENYGMPIVFKQLISIWGDSLVGVN